MTESPKHYLKIAFIRAEIRKNAIQFKSSNLRFVIKPQISQISLNPNIKIQPIQLKEIGRSQQYVFQQFNPKWDCIRLLENYQTLKPQLKLNFQIQKPYQTFSNQSKNKSYIPLTPFSISLDNFLLEPYKLHRINVDFNQIKSQEKQGQKGKQTGQKEKQTRYRYGMVTFELSFLKDLRAELEIKNLNLTTQLFSNSYKIGIYQVLTYRSDFNNDKIIAAQQKKLTKLDYIQSHHQNKTINKLYQYQKIKTRCTQLTLQPNSWKNFSNNQSYSQPHLIPLQLLNEEDEIAFLFEYLKQYKKTNNSIPNTVKSIIKIDKLFQMMKSPNEWTKFQVEIPSPNLPVNLQKFTFSFKFMIKLKNGQYQQNLPKPMIKPTKEQQKFDNGQSKFEMLTGKQDKEEKQIEKESPLQQFFSAFVSEAQP